MPGSEQVRRDPRRNGGARPLSWMWAVTGAGALLAWRIVGVRRTRERRLHRSLVEILLNVLSAGDEATSRHSRRVAALTDALACELGLSRERRATLRIAALLHDMGKVDERFYDIVHGRTELTREQVSRIRRHPAKSAHLLAPLEWAHPGLTDIVASHHERWDGRGYPRGLRAEEIPLEARLIAIADAYDAMTGERGYGGRTPATEALGTIRRGAGAQFDPALVRLLARRPVRRAFRGVAAENPSAGAPA